MFRVLNEVRILRSASHPCIIHLEDVVDTPDFLYIVLELAEGGELFDKIIEKTKFNEAEAKLHFYQMSSAISYLHSKVSLLSKIDWHGLILGVTSLIIARIFATVTSSQKISSFAPLMRKIQ